MVRCVTVQHLGPISGDHNGLATPLCNSISPYLFILCQEMFIRAISRQVQLANFDCLQSSRSAPAIPIFCFANDCMIFCKSNRKTIGALQSCLDIYEKTVGQAVCWEKSRALFSPNSPGPLNVVFCKP